VQTPNKFSAAEARQTSCRRAREFDDGLARPPRATAEPFLQMSRPKGEAGLAPSRRLLALGAAVGRARAGDHFGNYWWDGRPLLSDHGRRLCPARAARRLSPKLRGLPRNVGELRHCPREGVLMYRPHRRWRYQPWPFAAPAIRLASRKHHRPSQARQTVSTQAGRVDQSCGAQLASAKAASTLRPNPRTQRHRTLAALRSQPPEPRSMRSHYDPAVAAVQSRGSRVEAARANCRRTEGHSMKGAAPHPGAVPQPL